MADSICQPNLDLDSPYGFIVGAYATAPSLASANKTMEQAFYRELISQVDTIRGLEIPFWGDDIHQFGTEFLLKMLSPTWSNVLSCVPASFLGCVAEKHFGLASNNESGRKKAINMHRIANQKLHVLNEFFGHKSVIAVQIATAPSCPVEGVTSSTSSLQRSLDELLSWDWQGSRLVIEHCDRADPSGSFAKGFMPLEDEIEVLNGYVDGKNVGITINWARSAIEGKSIERPLEHLKMAEDHKVLAGLMFSGTSSNDELYGSWQDNHMPFAQSDEIEYFEGESLLTQENISNCLQVIDPLELDYLGIKLLGMPIDKCQISRRVGLNRDALTVLSSLLLNRGK